MKHKAKITAMRTSLATIVAFFFTAANSQGYSPSRIFAHNDYVQSQPFYTAYNLRVGFIEADVFLIGGDLLVAHHRNETDARRTLAALYLEPLSKQVAENRGSVYEDPGSHLTLMIDLKTEGTATLDNIVGLLQEYPSLLACSTLHFMISGNVPPPGKWTDYPSFISIDGRPAIPYTGEQLKRIVMISTNFRDHVNWDGKSKLSGEAMKKIKMLVDEVHAKGKRIRFWATPDFESAWKQQMDLNFDVIVTDDVTGLEAFIASQK
ncbi:MAG: glycerophosphodiester phosphodiesterase [Cyclobacteriaceae bacterium]